MAVFVYDYPLQSFGCDFEMYMQQVFLASQFVQQPAANKQVRFAPTVNLRGCPIFFLCQCNIGWSTVTHKCNVSSTKFLVIDFTLSYKSPQLIKRWKYESDVFECHNVLQGLFETCSLWQDQNTVISKVTLIKRPGIYIFCPNGIPYYVGIAFFVKRIKLRTQPSPKNENFLLSHGADLTLTLEQWRIVLRR
jgi:hypothetical protein